MSNYVIFTDSCIDLPAELADRLALRVLPLYVTVNNSIYHNYLDERDITFKDFYQFLREHKLSQTSQVNPQEFIDALEPILKDGNDILSISFSSALSGTYQSSVIAKEELLQRYPHRKIITIDSLCASMGQGLLLTYAADLKKQGLSLEELAKWVEKNKTKVCHLFTVGDLNHLKRGGRLSYAKAFIGTLLRIKPLLHVNMKGQLVQTGATRGRSRVLTKMIERMEQTIIEPEGQLIYISHGDCEADALVLKQMIIEKFPIKDVIINYVGPVIGSHSGIDTLALFYLGEDRTVPY
ncbi:MAG: DegV family protein [Bacilli bacterium]|nr:DegV family protein [Bacilli bacterium]MDD4077155.1 DegV family protein [Bacilli bacterium]